LKDDIGTKGTYKRWFTGEHLALALQYLLRNKNSIITDMFNLIWSDIISNVESFYHLMMDKQGHISAVRFAWQIH
jgi:hypothetical protein